MKISLGSRRLSRGERTSYLHRAAFLLLLALGGLSIILSGCGTAANSVPSNGSGNNPAPQPVVTFTPTSLVFGNQTVGTTSAAQSVTLQNTGNASLSLTSIGITGTNSGDFADSNTCGASVAAGASCTISVTFTPTAAGTRTASVSVTDNAGGSPQTVSLTGTGVSVGGSPVVSLSPGSLTFGNQNVGTTSAAQSVTLQNTGNASLSLTSIAVTGTDSGDFAETNTCGASVAAGASCTISVTFTPTAAGTRTASVSFTDNAAGSPQGVPLSGTGVSVGNNPVVSLSPGSLTFGNVNVGTTSGALSVTLQNTGNASLSLTSIAVTGTDSGDFAETNTCGSSVAAGASCTMSVTFTPPTAATDTAAVSITDNASGSPQSVPLSGTGVNPGSTGNTPLVDFAPGQKYLGTFPGLLYTDPVTGVDSNSVPAQHDTDGRAIAAQVVPLDSSGNPSSSGKIGVVGIGMSNWTDELCSAAPSGTNGSCNSYTFLGEAATNSSVNHTTLVLADCAQGGHAAKTWIDDTNGSYSTCINTLLPLWSITAAQVEVILWKDADGGPTVSMTSSTACTLQPLPIASSNPDVCTYEEYLGLMARFLKTEFPNVKMLFVHSRIYAGYATTALNPEPFAYEYGFATKWFLNAQMKQIATGTVDPVAGDLNYNNNTAPWIVWGPYWWAAGTTPCNNCEIAGQIWVQSDFQSDGTHPSPSGDTKVANSLINYYLSSPYAAWFKAQ